MKDIFEISKLGFGTSQIGGPAQIGGRLEGAKSIPRNQALEILHYAYDSGINFFDTSDKYGNAEELLGEAFSKIRDKVVIATKCGLTDTGGRNFSINYVSSCLDNSLRRLDTDYIDIFQLAKPGINDVTDELLSFFADRIKDGKVRYFGISVSSDKDGETYLTEEAAQSLQVFYNVLFTGCHEFINKCAAKKKFVIIRSPLNSGMLSGRYNMQTKFDPVDSRGRIFYGELLRERLAAVEKIKERFNLSAEEVSKFALNFILSNSSVDVVIPAASRLEQLKEYIRVFRDEKRFTAGKISQVISFSQKELNLEGNSQLK